MKQWILCCMLKIQIFFTNMKILMCYIVSVEMDKLTTRFALIGLSLNIYKTNFIFSKSELINYIKIME